LEGKKRNSKSHEGKTTNRCTANDLGGDVNSQASVKNVVDGGRREWKKKKHPQQESLSLAIKDMAYEGDLRLEKNLGKGGGGCAGWGLC